MGTNIDSFLEDGFVRLPGAVPSALAEEIRAQAALLVTTGGATESWRLGQASVYDMPLLIEAVTPAVRAAFDTLAGQGRWHVAANWGFPSRFPGPCSAQWHIDGDWFTHHVTSGEQVLTPIFLWSDVGIADSPTLLGVGSHRAVARLLADHEPDGIAGPEIGRLVNSAVKCDVVAPATGRAGDVIVCHPFLAHSINPDSPVQPRFISNVAVHGFGAIEINGRARAGTPVEMAIQQAFR